MRALYTGASEVLIWLGEADDGSEMLAYVILHTGIPAEPQQGSPEYEKLLNEFLLDMCKVSLLFQHIAKRDWWTRVWCVQECALAVRDPLIQCGTRCFTWTQFFTTFRNLFDRLLGAKILGQNRGDTRVHELSMKLGFPTATPEDDNDEHILSMERLSVLNALRDINHVTPKRNITLMVPIAPLMGRSATVPHDYVYGFLGFGCEEDISRIKVDYERSYWDLYQETMETWFCNGSKDEFHLVGLLSFSHEQNGYPSWVPDFSSQKSNDRNGGFAMFNMHSAWTWHAPPDFWFSDDGQVFMPEGVILDVVEDVHYIEPGRAKLQTILSALDTGLSSTIARRETLDRASATQLDSIRSYPSFRRLFTCDSSNLRNLAITDEKLDLCWKHAMYPGSPPLGSKERSEAREDLAGYSVDSVVSQMISFASLAASGRNLVITKTGFVGIGVPTMKPGDVVAHFYGFPMPLALRMGTDHYTIVGGVYLDGLMDGSVLDECVEEDLLHRATIRIR